MCTAQIQSHRVPTPIKNINTAPAAKTRSAFNWYKRAAVQTSKLKGDDKLPCYPINSRKDFKYVTNLPDNNTCNVTLTGQQVHGTSIWTHIWVCILDLFHYRKAHDKDVKAKGDEVTGGRRKF